MHALAEDHAVRPGEVHVLEDALRRLRGRERPERVLAVAADDQQLAGGDVPHVFRPDQIERAGLRADHGGVAEGAQHQGAEPVGVAHRHQAVPGQDHQRERPPHLPDRLDDGVGRRPGRRPGVEMQHDLGVAPRLEDVPPSDQGVAQLGRVDEVPVVAEGDLAVRAVDENRLRVDDLAVARRRVPHVADRRIAAERRQRLLVDGLRHLPHRPRQVQALAVGGGDAGALLPPVLQRIQPETGQRGRLRVTVNAEDAALVVESVVVHGYLRYTAAGSK